MADGIRLGIDWGKARIGVAACNAGTALAYPVATVQAGAGELKQICSIVGEYEPGVIYVGLPLTLAGQRGPSAEFVIGKTTALAHAVWPIQVRLVDERMSTASVSRSLSGVGRRAKAQRSVIDQAAAVEILQRALDAEHREGEPVGELVKEEQ